MNVKQWKRLLSLNLVLVLLLTMLPLGVLAEESQSVTVNVVDAVRGTSGEMVFQIGDALRKYPYLDGWTTTIASNTYLFKGWAVEEGGNVVYLATDLVTAALPDTLYPRWEKLPESYILASGTLYGLNSSTGEYGYQYGRAADNSTVWVFPVENGSVTLPQEPVFTLPGLVQMGWEYLGVQENKLVTEFYSFGDTVSADREELTAVYGKPVVFHLNDGTNETQTDIFRHDENTGGLPSLVRVGYRFLGWNSKADGTGNTYQGYVLGGNLPGDLYAIWEETDGYWFRFREDQADPGELVMVQSLTTGSDLVLFSHINPLRDQTDRFLTGLTVNGEAVCFMDPLQGHCTEGQETQVLGVWQTAAAPAVHYLGFGRSGICTDAVDNYVDAHGAGTVTLRGSDTFTPDHPDRVLVGWKDPGEEALYLPGQTVELTENLTLEAVYGYAMIRTDLNYPGAAKGQSKFWLTSSGSLSWFDQPQRDGYLFQGWNTKADGSGTMYAADTELSKLPKGGLCLYACWEQLPEGDYYILRSPIAFENGGFATAVAADQPLPKTVGEQPVFVWRNQKDKNLWRYANPGAAAALPSGSILEMIPYVEDRSCAYLILDGNGGVGFDTGSAAQYVIKSMNTTVSSMNLETYLSGYETFVKAGHAWIGWNTERDGSGTGYSMNEALDIVAVPGKTVTLYAQWAVRVGDNAVLYSGNGGKTADGAATVVQSWEGGSTWTPLDNPFTRDGKYFLGWEGWVFKNGAWIGTLNLIAQPGEPVDVTGWDNWDIKMDQLTMTALWGYARVTYQYSRSFQRVVYQEPDQFEEYFEWGMASRNAFFRGWNTRADGTGSWYLPGADIPAGLSVNLYPIMVQPTEENCLLVTLANSFADGSRVQQVELTDGQATITLPEVDGALGWMVYPALKENKNITLTYGTSLESGILVPAGTQVTVKAGQVIYAVEATGNPWYDDLRIYHGNGGVSVNEPAEEIRVQIVNASDGSMSLYGEGSFQRTGYTLTGWNTKADGSGKAYGLGEDAYVQGELELFAQWRSNSSEKPDAVLPQRPTVPVAPTRPSVIGFRDVQAGDWFADAVTYVVKQNLMRGTGEETFSPGAVMTRAMLVQILYNLEGQPKVGDSGFADVPSGMWYHDAVAWAVENQITTGYSAAKFGPQDPVTREQLAVFLFRYAVSKGLHEVTLEERLSGFVDGNAVSPFAVQALNWAVSQGFIGGRDDGTLDPQGQATRAEAAAILMRYHKQIS